MVQAVQFYILNNDMQNEITHLVYIQKNEIHLKTIKETRHTEEIKEIIDQGYLSSAGLITKEKPEQFLEYLQERYRGTYFYATKPMQIAVSI